MLRQDEFERLTADANDLVARGDRAGALEKAHQLSTSCMLGEYAREIGDLYMRLGYSAMAGRHWYFLRDQTPEMQQACAEFEKSCGDSVHAISITCVFPQANKCRELDDDKYKSALQRQDALDKRWGRVQRPSRFRDRVALLGCGLVATLLLVIFSAGIAALMGLRRK